MERGNLITDYKNFVINKLFDFITYEINFFISMTQYYNFLHASTGDFPYRLKKALALISENESPELIYIETYFIDYQIHYLYDRYEEVFLEKLKSENKSIKEIQEIMGVKHISEIMFIEDGLENYDYENDKKRILRLLEKFNSF
jgi:hypothetical protein